MKWRRILIAAASAACVPAGAMAQDPTPGDRPSDAISVLPLGPSDPAIAAIGPERAVLPAIAPRFGRMVHNVSTPSLTVFKPTNKAQDNHTAIIIAPGGGWRWLMIDVEGYEVARRLAARGYTAFVLKYRVKKTPDDDAAFTKDAMAFVGRIFVPKPNVEDSTPNPEAFADGVSAVRYVRNHAVDLGVAPDRIGIIGFSGGGIPAAAAATARDPSSRANFFGLIYGASAAIRSWNADTAPAFVAVAADDPVLGSLIRPGYEAMIRAGASVELHLYRNGGHGFVTSTTGTSADLWLDELCAWASALGYGSAPRP